jgi:hypothetical protein
MHIIVTYSHFVYWVLKNFMCDLPCVSIIQYLAGRPQNLFSIFWTSLMAESVCFIGAISDCNFAIPVWISKAAAAGLSAFSAKDKTKKIKHFSVLHVNL